MIPTTLATALSTSLAWCISLSYIIGIGMAIYAICTEKSPQTAIAWSLGLIFLPPLSLPLYLALGSGRIHRQNKGQLPPQSCQNLKELWQSNQSPYDPRTSAIAKLSNMPACAGNKLQLLQNGNEAYYSLYEAVRDAKISILIEFYIIKDDRVGNKMCDLLIDKAKQGLQIYLIYDEIGSHKLPLGFILRLKMAGVRITPFHGKRFWLSSILRINYRNHRKLVIIDGQDAWMGGLNIGNEYYARRNKQSWRDSFLHIQGPAVAQALYSFAKDWYHAQGEDLIPSIPCHGRHVGTQSAMILCSGPNDKSNTWLMSLVSLFSTAKQRIWLAAPYLVPNHALSCALQAAALRGVHVRILVPAQGDHRVVHLAMLTYLQDMEAYGIEIRGYQPNFMHQKALLIDDDISWIGSANLDMRSLDLNYELGCLMHDRYMATLVESMLERDFEQSIPMTSDLLESASIWKQFSARAARLLAPLL